MKTRDVSGDIANGSSNMLMKCHLACKRRIFALDFHNILYLRPKIQGLLLKLLMLKISASSVGFLKL